MTYGGFRVSCERCGRKFNRMLNSQKVCRNCVNVRPSEGVSVTVKRSRLNG